MIQQVQVDKNILNRFVASLRNKKLAHAYLLIGPKDAGKAETAIAVAKLVNCDENQKGERDNFCGQCPCCIKIDSGNHPDVLVVDIEEGDTIKIAQIRELVAQSQLRPFEAAKKVFIVKNAERLTTESSNALLKTLEEPTPTSLLILTTSVPEKCLDTVKSRCHAIHFFPASKDNIAAQLQEIYDTGAVDSHILAYFSEGCFGKAKRLYDKDFVDKKNEIINRVIFEDNNEVYLKKVLADKESIKDMLDVLLFWFRDLLLLKVGIEEHSLVHLDRINDLCALSRGYSFEQLNDIIRQIVNTSKLLGANLNVKIPVELLKEKIWVR